MDALDVLGSVEGDCLFDFEDDVEETVFVTAAGFGAFFAVDFASSDDSVGVVFETCLDEERSTDFNADFFQIPPGLALLDERDFFKAEIGLSSSLSLPRSLSSGSVLLVSFLRLRLFVLAMGGEGRVSARA